MAQVIKGVFPQSTKNVTADNKNDKQVPSYVLHISITFSDPLIWRRVQVPGAFTLAQLHDTIQLSMGWSDSHVHQFLVGKISYEPTMKTRVPREAKRFDEYKYKLHTLEEGMRFMFSYIYGAGEGWEHEIHLEEVVPPTRQLKHPVLLAGEMACPPETIGDIHQYLQLITDLESPDGRKTDSLFELTGRPDFDPNYFDLAAAKKRVSLGR
ncbi:plasmid pRiA4b ORF-3 family protein [Desulfopila sp. IMCC35006]|uniref:plasmid pRiA4b ORF-3 family protein n=1 Tax=Desulfopila sp. IMCC35006 TaxID=2569542 RepID=UPI0010AB4F6B|nr:plasmid pRiA4b ORF-3 family protein [Desulfopila sp. IMCC35006]TKB28524.1 plasmid pRiA4b ORF-3 family protein [Desulfopila sp. IMCC35006]